MTETSASATNGPDVPAARERARLSFDLDVDIAIVGAGLAGLTVALEAARLGASVAVLEGRHVGWNASGHQLGTVMPGYGLPIGDLIARIGFEDARELWALSKQGAEYVRAMASEQSMPGMALSEGALEVSNVDSGDQLISRLQMLGADFETEHGSQRARHKARVAERRQIDQPDAMLTGGDQRLGHSEGDGSLADPARSDDRDQTLARQSRRECADGIGAADHSRQVSRQIVPGLGRSRLRRHRFRLLCAGDRRDEAVAASRDVEQIPVAAA